MVRFVAKVETSDILVIMPEAAALEVLRETAIQFIKDIRQVIKDHINRNPAFLTSLEPLAYQGEVAILQRMHDASKKAGVGPMAAVAGITSEYVGEKLMERFGVSDLLIENGGDLYIVSTKDRHIAIHAGDSPLSDRLKLRITSDKTPIGICTSAGTIGHSLSLGKADAVVVMSRDTALADAVATASGNRIQNADDIGEALEFAMAVEGILGAVVIIGDKVGAIGDVEFH